jgi:hypothetical protein
MKTCEDNQLELYTGFLYTFVKYYINTPGDDAIYYTLRVIIYNLINGRNETDIILDAFFCGKQLDEESRKFMKRIIRGGNLPRQLKCAWDSCKDDCMKFTWDKQDPPHVLPHNILDILMD